ncbi:MAG: hypothetical protein SVY10_16660, partial [Thermodesulfobacteriota bacterium]|nr:hypothetical protein [Thermodesulfobacteriota bacterium]
MKLRNDEEKINHLNLLLLIIRKINKLIISERDVHVLLKETCDTLVESGHYNHAWIATMDESGFLSKTAESGLKREFSS